jgi:hypothetical protein
LRSEEKVTEPHFRQGKSTLETTSRHWVWITTLEATVFPAKTVWRLGQTRWKKENNGWNDLTQNWALEHGLLHACKHRPKTLSASGQREPVPNPTSTT